MLELRVRGMEAESEIMKCQEKEKSELASCCCSHCYGCSDTGILCPNGPDGTKNRMISNLMVIFNIYWLFS